MSKVKLALEVITDLRSLADSIEALAGAMQESESNTIAAEEKDTTKNIKTTKKKTSKKEVQAKQPSLEMIRALMANKNREGHREEIKTIIKNHSANRLTEIDPKDYAEVMKEVEAIK